MSTIYTKKKEMKCKSNPGGPTHSIVSIMTKLFTLLKQKSFLVITTDKTSGFDRKVYYKKGKQAQGILNTSVPMYTMSLPFIWCLFPVSLIQGPFYS
jgi:hypothetical protein